MLHKDAEPPLSGTPLPKRFEAVRYTHYLFRDKRSQDYHPRTTVRIPASDRDPILQGPGIPLQFTPKGAQDWNTSSSTRYTEAKSSASINIPI